MAHLIKPNEIKLVTKNNELFVNISLELNIKLDGNVTNLNLNNNQSNITKEEEKTNWEIPDFSTDKKINFGK